MRLPTGLLVMKPQVWLIVVACVLPNWLGAAPVDGQWRLSISGHSTYYFGEPQLGGGLRIPWEVAIAFTVVAGEFTLGSGQARIVGEPVAISQPAGWVRCRQVDGSYLDSNLTLHDTPRIRFAAFPVAGSVVDGQIELRPAYTPPGNYLAVTYECTLRDSRANHWFALAERDKQVLGKRQDAEKRVDGDLLSARVREVVSLPPESGLTLPLVDGWQFTRGDADDRRRVAYHLRRESNVAAR